jgi:hypothetical protein
MAARAFYSVLQALGLEVRAFGLALQVSGVGSPRVGSALQALDSEAHAFCLAFHSPDLEARAFSMALQTSDSKPKLLLDGSKQRIRKTALFACPGLESPSFGLQLSLLPSPAVLSTRVAQQGASELPPEKSRAGNPARLLFRLVRAWMSLERNAPTVDGAYVLGGIIDHA